MNDHDDRINIMADSPTLIPAKFKASRKKFADHMADIEVFSFDDMEKLGDFVSGLTDNGVAKGDGYTHFDASLKELKDDMAEGGEQNRASYKAAVKSLKSYLSQHKAVFKARKVALIHGDLGAEALRYHKSHWAASLVKNRTAITKTMDALQPVVRLAVLLQEEGQPRDAAQVKAAWLINSLLETRQNEQDYVVLPALLAVERMRYAEDRFNLSTRVSCDKWAKKLVTAADNALCRVALDITPQAGALICIGGMSGVGKSSVSKELAGDVAATRPSIILRSDAIRKQAWGLKDLRAKLPAEAYRDKANNKKRQAILYSRAKAALKAGFTVILDETHQADWHRKNVEKFAKDMNVDFKAYWLTADEATLKARINARKGDISDADAKILDMQLAEAKKGAAVMWPHVKATGTPQEIAREIRLKGKALAPRI